MCLISFPHKLAATSLELHKDLAIEGLKSRGTGNDRLKSNIRYEQQISIGAGEDTYGFGYSNDIHPGKTS